MCVCACAHACVYVFPLQLCSYIKHNFVYVLYYLLDDSNTTSIVIIGTSIAIVVSLVIAIIIVIIIVQARRARERNKNIRTGRFNAVEVPIAIEEERCSYIHYYLLT